jgi:raffinose/stachyose/melibiose transport system permease protein
MRMTRKHSRALRATLRLLPLVLFALVVLTPLSIVFFGSLKTAKELFASPFLPPKAPVLDNFPTAFLQGNMLVYFRNTLFISVVSLGAILSFSSLGAYALTRKGFRFGNRLYAYFVFGIIIPASGLTIPTYVLMSRLGLVNNLWSVILVDAATCLPFAVFVLSGFFRTIPPEMDEAAMIDGCSDFQAFLKVILPQCQAAVSTVFILNLLYIWNDFYNPLLYIRSERLKPISLGLTNYLGRYVANYPIMFAAVVMASVPVIVVFIVLQKQFISGVTAGAVKG